LKGLIMGALDTVLGNASAGEKETDGFTVMLLHGAVVRIDYYVYAYTFRSDGAATKLQNGLVFAVSIATVRLASVNSEVIALLSGLTAEGSVGYMQRYNRKMKAIGDKAKLLGNSNYTTEEAISLIISLFGGDSTKVPIDDTGAQTYAAGLSARARLNQISNEFKLVDRPDEERAKVNALLCGLTVVSDIPKSELQEVFDEQKKILEKMSQIYVKIAQMKRSTNASVAYAENRAASDPNAR